MRAVQAWRIVRLCDPGAREERRAQAAAGELHMAMTRFGSVLTWLRTRGRDGLANSLEKQADDLFELCGYPKGFAGAMEWPVRSRWHPPCRKDGSIPGPEKADREFDKAWPFLFDLSNGFVAELDRIRKMLVEEHKAGLAADVLVLPDDRMPPLTVAQIAEKLGHDPKKASGALKGRLARFRRDFPHEGWYRTNAKKKNEPQYVYEWEKVKPFVQGVLPVSPA